MNSCNRIPYMDRLRKDINTLFSAITKALAKEYFEGAVLSSTVVAEIKFSASKII